MNGSFEGLLRGKLHPWTTIALALVLLLGCRPALHAQGLINFLNNSATLITLSSNFSTVAMPSGQPGAFRFELFVAPAGTLSPASFTATGLIATNQSSAGRLYGGNQLAVPGVPLGGIRAILVRGWSANLGSNYASAIVAWQNYEPGYLGESSIASDFIFGGFNGEFTIPTSPAFGGSSGIQSGFELRNNGCLSCNPFFLVYPSNAVVSLGGDVTLSSYARSYYPYPPVRYQWRKQGSPIAGATNSSLILRHVTMSDAGNYDVVANTIYGSSASPVATLTVFIPAIAATLGSPTYTTNNQFQFTVTGTASSNYVVQVSTNLATADWVSLLTNASPFTFVDTKADSFPQRFYRAYAP